MLANLKAALAARRMKQFELAAELGISPAAVTEIILGRRRTEAELRARVASILAADADWLFQDVIPRAAKPGPAIEAVASARG